MKGQEPWLVPLSGPADPEVELIMVPGAGDGPTTARTLPPYLPPSWRLSSVCLPGRGHRFDEPLAEDPYAMLDSVVDVLDSLGPAPVVLLGHSLGALWALEAGGRLARPPALVATVACAPPRPGGASGMEEPDDTEDRRFIRGLLMDQGLTDPECLDELVELTVPIFHADLSLAARWAAPGRPVLVCPVVSYYASEDGLAPTPWTWHTTGQAEAVWLEGGHIVHQERSAELLADLSRRAAPYLVPHAASVLTQGLRGPSLAARSGSTR